MDLDRVVTTYLRHKTFVNLHKATLAVILIIAIGTVTYMKLMGLTLIDALYFTVITLASVGYGDITPSTPEARLFTVFFVMGGISTFLYAFSVIVSMVFEGEVLEVLKMESEQEKLSKLREHTIICGYGDVGAILAKNLENRVVVDKDEKKIPQLLEEGIFAITGDSTRPETLVKARIGTAKAIVVALNSDPDVLFTILNAKDLNPSIRVYARANHKDSVKNMQSVGADYVVCLPEIGGRELMEAISKAGR